MLLPLVIKANEFGLKFILPYWGIIGFDIGFINLSNAFIDRLRVPIYHCKAPNKITTFKHKFIYNEKKIAYRNCQLFQFRLNQYTLNDNGDLIYGFSGDYQLTLYDNSFRKHRIIRRKVPEAKIVTEKEKDEWIEYHNKLLAKRGVKIKKSDLDFPERHRVLENIWMTSGNEILVLTCIKMNKAYIDVFNSNGIYTKKWIFTNPSDVIPIAEHFRKPIFKNQKIYAVVRHNDGLIQVKRYRIIPTPNLDTTD